MNENMKKINNFELIKASELELFVVVFQGTKSSAVAY